MKQVFYVLTFAFVLSSCKDKDKDAPTPDNSGPSAKTVMVAASWKDLGQYTNGVLSKAPADTFTLYVDGTGICNSSDVNRDSKPIEWKFANNETRIEIRVRVTPYALQGTIGNISQLNDTSLYIESSNIVNKYQKINWHP